MLLQMTKFHFLGWLVVILRQNSFLFGIFKIHFSADGHLVVFVSCCLCSVAWEPAGALTLRHADFHPLIRGTSASISVLDALLHAKQSMGLRAFGKRPQGTKHHGAKMPKYFSALHFKFLQFLHKNVLPTLLELSVNFASPLLLLPRNASMQV